MTPLSPAAQAQKVLDAVRKICPAPADEIAAAAIRAAADQVMPDLPKPIDEGTRQADTQMDYWEDCQQHRAKLLAIAAELDGTTPAES